MVFIMIKERSWLTITVVVVARYLAPKVSEYDQKKLLSHHRRAIKEKSKVASSDSVDQQACSLLR